MHNTIHIRTKVAVAQLLNLYHLVRATDKTLSKNCHMYESVTRVTKLGNYHFLPCVIYSHRLESSVRCADFRYVFFRLFQQFYDMIN